MPTTSFYFRQEATASNLRLVPDDDDDDECNIKKDGYSILEGIDISSAAIQNEVLSRKIKKWYYYIKNIYVLGIIQSQFEFLFNQYFKYGTTKFKKGPKWQSSVKLKCNLRSSSNKNL